MITVPTLSGYYWNKWLNIYKVCRTMTDIEESQLKRSFLFLFSSSSSSPPSSLLCHGGPKRLWLAQGHISSAGWGKSSNPVVISPRDMNIFSFPSIFLLHSNTKIHSSCQGSNQHRSIQRKWLGSAPYSASLCRGIHSKLMLGMLLNTSPFRTQM